MSPKYFKLDEDTGGDTYTVLTGGTHGNVLDTTATSHINTPSLPHIKMEEPEMPFAQKICVDCKKPFDPSSGSQLRCVPCIKIFKETHKPDFKKKKDPTTVTTHTCESDAVLKVLVAVGVLSEDQVTGAQNAIALMKGGK